MKRKYIESTFEALGDLVATMWEKYEKEEEDNPEPALKPMCELEYAQRNYPVGSDVLYVEKDNMHIYKVNTTPWLVFGAGVHIDTSGGIFSIELLTPLKEYSYTIARPVVI